MTNKIPYGLHTIDESDIQAVVEILRSGTITQGETVEEFGQALANYVGAEYGVAVSNGTAALHIAVAALNIKSGDEVITTPMTFCATSNSVLYQGGNVKFVDIDDKTLNIDPELIEEKITPQTKAIIPVDFRGHPANMPAIKAIANKHNLKIIEDGAQSLGSSYFDAGQEYFCGNGNHSDLVTSSFHPVKHITTGEGGVVFTNDVGLYEKLTLLRKHGIDRREIMFDEVARRGSWIYDMFELGFNYRITDFQAALGISQLKKINKFKHRRRKIVDYYNQRFASMENLIVPFEDKDVNSNFHLYTLQVRENKKFDRYDLFSYLQRNNYAPMVHYIPVHLLTYYKQAFGFKQGDFPVAEKYYERTISIPLYPGLSDLMVEKVVNDIAKFVS
jgi:perosamine synthetase